MVPGLVMILTMMELYTLFFQLWDWMMTLLSAMENLMQVV